MTTRLRPRSLALTAIFTLMSCGDLDNDAGETLSSAVAVLTSPPRGFLTSSGDPWIIAKTVSSQIALYLAAGLPPSGPLLFPVHVQQTATPWGYTRHDGISSFLYLDSNGHPHQLLYPNLNGNFIDTDLTGATINAPIAKVSTSAKAPTPDVIGYVRLQRSLLHSAIVYISADNHVIELLSNSTVSYPTIQYSFLWTDLTRDSGASVTCNRGSAFPHVRADGINTIYYIGSDNHIHELANFGTPSWFDYDAHIASGETIVPKSDPTVYTRSDGYDTVVFEGNDSMIHELAYRSDLGWGHGTLPSVGALNGMRGRPFGYVRADGMNTIVYVSNKNSVHELALWPNGWADAALPIGANEVPEGQVFGLRSQGASSVLFQVSLSSELQGRVLDLPVGGHWLNFPLPW